jgi:integrase
VASLQKIQYIRWVDAEGKRVPRGTPGAVKVREKSAKWYACWKEGGRQIRVPLATDKSASQTMLADLLRDKERGRAGMIDPFQHHLDRAISEHRDEYLASIRQSGKVRSEKYFSEKQRILTVILNACDMRTLADLTAESVDRYMDGLACSAATRRVHHTAINAFASWLVQKRRVSGNPLIGVARPQGGKVVRKRRALGPEELQRLLDAARERPLASAEWNSGGRLPKGKERRFRAELKSHTRERYIRIGRERALLYKTAIYTGLRKGELAALRVKFLNLDRKPYPCLELPGEFTKNGEDARLLLVPALAEELRELIAGKRPNALVFKMPGQMVPVMKRDLKRAGIPYQDDRGRFADFHSLRKSAGTMLGVAGVPTRIRQLFMRHGDVRLTLQTYDDADFSSLEEAVKAMEHLNLR